MSSRGQGKGARSRGWGGVEVPATGKEELHKEVMLLTWKHYQVMSPYVEANVEYGCV